MYMTAALIRCCIKFGVPCMLENPVNSMLFQAFSIAKLLKHKSCTSVIFDRWRFGIRWRKRTRLVMWNCCESDSLDIRCMGSASLCSASGKSHILLKGNSPDGTLWTKIAQVHPTKLCYGIADILINSYENRKCIILLESAALAIKLKFGYLVSTLQPLIFTCRSLAS